MPFSFNIDTTPSRVALLDLDSPSWSEDCARLGGRDDVFVITDSASLGKVTRPNLILRRPGLRTVLVPQAADIPSTELVAEIFARGIPRAYGLVICAQQQSLSTVIEAIAHDGSESGYRKILGEIGLRAHVREQRLGRLLVATTFHCARTRDIECAADNTISYGTRLENTGRPWREAFVHLAVEKSHQKVNVEPLTDRAFGRLRNEERLHLQIVGRPGMRRGGADLCALFGMCAG